MNHNSNSGENSENQTPAISAAVADETRLEYISDAVLGIAFVMVGIVAAQRSVSP